MSPLSKVGSARRSNRDAEQMAEHAGSAVRRRSTVLLARRTTASMTYWVRPNRGPIVWLWALCRWRVLAGGGTVRGDCRRMAFGDARTNTAAVPRRSRMQVSPTVRSFPGSRLQNSLGCGLNSRFPGEHPVVLDCRLCVLGREDSSGEPRSVETRPSTCLHRHRWMTGGPGRAPALDRRFGRRHAVCYVTRRTSWSVVSASTPNMQWHITFEAPRTRT